MTDSGPRGARAHPAWKSKSSRSVPPARRGQAPQSTFNLVLHSGRGHGPRDSGGSAPRNAVARKDIRGAPPSDLKRPESSTGSGPGRERFRDQRVPPNRDLENRSETGIDLADDDARPGPLRDPARFPGTIQRVDPPNGGGCGILIACEQPGRRRGGRGGRRGGTGLRALGGSSPLVRGRRAARLIWNALPARISPRKDPLQRCLAYGRSSQRSTAVMPPAT
jgi:hypothetical protein